MKEPTCNLEDAINYIENINFTHLTNRLITQKKWKNQRATDAIQRYKRFLFLQKKYDGQCDFVPSQEIDEVWHEHILFTKQYHQDCEYLFGRYIHHEPENNTEVSLREAEKNANKTEELYLREYGEKLYGEPIFHVLREIFIQWTGWLRSLK